jgi:hypothetical protein
VKAGKKASNVQSKWDSTASIIADVFTVKKNGFFRSKNGSFYAELRSPRVSAFDVLKVRLRQKPLPAIASAQAKRAGLCGLLNPLILKIKT